MRIHHWTLSALGLVLAFSVFIACTPQPAVIPTPPKDLTISTPATPVDSSRAGSLREVLLGVGYIPNVQFAPFYVAQRKGFFEEQGLSVVMQYGYEVDFVTLTGQGEREFAVASGDQVILARSQGLPMIYVAKWYQRYPVGVMTPVEKGIDSPKKLEGHSVGIPVLHGASYVGWKALAYAAKLDEQAIRLEVTGFSQVESVSQGIVDAAVIYVANEPVQMRYLNKPVYVFEASDYINMVSNGIVTNERMIQEQPDVVRQLVQGFLKGLQYTLDHPDEAFAIVRQVVPEITDEQAPVQRAVLDASLALWRTDQLGRSDPAAWSDTITVMKAAGMIETAPDVETLYTNQFVE
ncbi:MAG: ABC transporter substrate-binding protein [Anaerolineae bacterium]